MGTQQSEKQVASDACACGLASEERRHGSSLRVKPCANPFSLISSPKVPPRLRNTPMCHRFHNDFYVRTQHSGRGKAPLPKGASPSATPFPLLPPGCVHRGPRAKCHQTSHTAETLPISPKLFWALVRLQRNC